MCIFQSYVKWLEMAGARVVPLSFHAGDAETDEIFEQADGALFSGGGGDVPPSARRIYSRAVAAHAKGDSFPIWGTCDGFEWLMQIGAADDGVLKAGFDSENMSLPLNFTDAAAQSRLLADAADTPVQGMRPQLSVLNALANLPLTLNNHQQGVTPSDFANSKLPSVFQVLATNVDRKGRPFVSVVEGKGRLPIWATQFHPEKNIFEQGETGAGLAFEAISHSIAAVAVSQYMANFFVQQVRGSRHSYSSAKALQSELFYGDQTSTLFTPAFVQVYVLKDGRGQQDDAAADG